MADIKLLTSWNTQFYKNITKNGGAMAAAIKNKKSQDINIHSQTEKYGRVWGYCSPERLLTLIEKNHGIYEIITNYPHKVYFDIDKKNDGCIPTEYLVSVKNIILDLFPNADMGISGSIKKDKISYHIILNNYMILNKDQTFIIKELVKYIASNIDSAFDWKVYTTNRNMKCINQSKADGRIQEIIELDDFKKHLITCWFHDYLPLPTFNQTITEAIHIEKSKLPFNVASLPKLLLKVPKNINIDNPLEILQILPINSTFDFAYSHLIARFCYYNNISFDIYLSWLCNKKPITKNEQGQKQWDDLAKYPPVSITKIKAVLNYFYPTINRDRSYKDFTETFNLPFITEIETINQLCFKRQEKYAIFNTGMGSGKTAQTIDYLNNKNDYMWICPNKALASNTLNRINENGSQCAHYLDFSTESKKNGILNEQNKLIIVLNSLHYVVKKFNIIVIDEIETLLDKFLGDFMEQEEQLKQSIWTNFINLIRTADKVILLDAFITTKTLNFIKNIEGDQYDSIAVFTRSNEPITRTITYMNNFQLTLYDIIQKIKQGSKIFIFYPYKKSSGSHQSMECIYNTIQTETGKRGIYYNADIDDKIKAELKNVNKAWNHQHFVITNNIITCGVNYERLDFDYKYLFVASFNTPRDIIQVSYRARHLSTGKINICYMGKMNQVNAWTNDCNKINCPIYTGLFNNILIEKKSPIKRSLQFFCKKAHYKQEDIDQTINKIIEKEIDDLLTVHQCSLRYNNINIIEEHIADTYERYCFEQKATLCQKAELNKYYFINQFTDDVSDNEILGNIWNCNCLTFIKQIRYVLKNPDCVFNKIMKFNAMSALFPTDLKHMKLNDDLLDEIFNLFTFKFITRLSGTCKILTEIYNIYFCTFIVSIQYNTTHIDYTIDPIYNEYYEFCKDNLILNHSTNETFDNKQIATAYAIEI